MRARRWTSAAVSALGVVVAGLLLAEVEGGITAWLTAAFLLSGPGLALIARLRFDDAWVEASLVVAIGVALTIALAQAMIWSGQWQPKAAVVVIAVVTVPLVATNCWNMPPRRSRSTPDTVATSGTKR